MWDGAVATVVPARRQQVQGLIWRVTRSDIEALDHYEGWPRFYGRKSFSVMASGGSKVDVFAYFIPSKLLHFAHPSRLYLDVMMAAYAKWDFDFSPLLNCYE